MAELARAAVELRPLGLTLDQATLDTFPITRFGLTQAKNVGCPICLVDFEEEEREVKQKVKIIVEGGEASIEGEEARIEGKKAGIEGNEAEGAEARVEREEAGSSRASGEARKGKEVKEEPAAGSSASMADGKKTKGAQENDGKGKAETEEVTRPNDDVRVLPCGHVYHVACIGKPVLDVIYFLLLLLLFDILLVLFRISHTRFLFLFYFPQSITTYRSMAHRKVTLLSCLQTQSSPERSARAPETAPDGRRTSSEGRN